MLEHFKDLLLSFPHRGFEKWRTISFFFSFFLFQGLTLKSKKLVVTMCQEEFMNKTANEAKTCFDRLAKNTR